MTPVRLGNHELLIRLASGGAANVFLVRDLEAPPPGRLLALKILLPSLAANEDFVNMFFTEARIASYIRHPNVVTIAGFGQADGIHCLAMEYVFGASLAQVLRASSKAKKPLTVGVLLRITAAVCDALHYAHELRDEAKNPLGVVHRDVTPQNILIGFNGVPKLTDFGIAKATNRGWETQAGIVKGKFSYMSPEQAMGKKVDRRSDIFGTGIVLWEALTGRDLFRGSTPMEVLTAIREQKIEPPSKVVPGLTPIVDPIVMKALRRNPKGRYQTAAQMRDAIEDLIQRAGVEIDSATISREFAAIYGDEIVERAFALRASMAGRADIEHLAKCLGGSPLNPKHLPVIHTGVSDPDPLGLFGESGVPHELSGSPHDSVMPARLDHSFSDARAIVDDFEIIDDEDEELEAISRLEPEPFVAEEVAPEVPDERLVSGWDDSTAMAVPDDELLSMISEEDATIGYLPPEFAERFGQELKSALEDSLDPDFEDELTVGMPDGQKLRVLSSDDDSHSDAWAPGIFRARVIPGARTERAPPKSTRPVPRAPSLLLEEGLSFEELDLVSGRPVPRAPSLDMDDRNTPLPDLSLDYDPMEEPPLPSRPHLKNPPPLRRDSMRVEVEANRSRDIPPLAPSLPSMPTLNAYEEPPSSMPGAPVLDTNEPRGAAVVYDTDSGQEHEVDLLDLDLASAPANGSTTDRQPSPMPAGALESLLSPDALRALAEGTPAPADLRPRAPSAPIHMSPARASTPSPPASGSSMPAAAPMMVVAPPEHRGLTLTPLMMVLLVIALLAAGAAIGLFLAQRV